MTTRIKGVYVAFDDDLREDDAESILNAIRQLKHVVEVTSVEAKAEDWMARQRVRSDIASRFGRLWTYILTGKEGP